MFYFILVLICIIIVSIGINALLGFLLFRKRQLRIAEDNNRIEKAEELKRELLKREEEYSDKIKNAKSVDDFLSIRDSILSNINN